MVQWNKALAAKDLGSKPALTRWGTIIQLFFHKTTPTGGFCESGALQSHCVPM